MSKYVRWFKELHRTDIPIAGGKGANLGEMFNNSFPVPPGFVIIADAYKDFIKEKGIDKKIINILSAVDVNNPEALDKASKEISEIFLKEEIPKRMDEEIIAAYSVMDSDAEIIKSKTAHELIHAGRDPMFVAVRSSATAEDLPQASFAGQQATLLNVKGNQNLLKAVKECWASLFTSRAIYYRAKNNFDHMKVAIAVVIQKMVNSEKSGIMFSINPVTNNKNQILIEAIRGLGEAVVSGAVNPNTYLIDKTTKKIVEKEIPAQLFMLTRNAMGHNIKVNLDPEKQKSEVLNEKELEVLFRLALKSEQHYNFPQDMEWAIEKNKIFMVQTRPVTTIKKEEVKVEVKTEGKEVILKGLGASPGVSFGKVVIIKDFSELSKVQKGDVLVTNMTNPDMVPAMQKAAGIVTNEGGIACHAAIVSREMGVPCVVGTVKATHLLKEGDIITVNGTTGEVYKGKLEAEVKAAAEKAEEVLTGEQLPTKIQIKVIMDLPEFAERAAKTLPDGVGLLRLEGIIASGQIHPAKYLADKNLDAYTKLLADGIIKIAEKFPNKPIWVRNSDIRTDEYSNLKGGELEPKEPNPMIGWHGIRRLLDQPDLLKAEFKAIKLVHEKGFRKVGIMLPFVISVDEVKMAKTLLREVGLEPQEDVEFGVMIETPASVWIIEDLCREGIDFISFGTNDLTQVTLGVDRNNERIQKIYDAMHPAVLAEIEYVINVCKVNNVQTSICGQAGSDAKMAEFLVRKGINSISANSDAVNAIRKLVYETEKKLDVN